MSTNREMVFDLRTGRIHAAVPSPPVLKSPKRDWDGFRFELHSTPAFELNEVMFLNHVVAVHTGDPVQLEWKIEGRPRRQLIRAGDINIIPSQIPFSTKGNGYGKFAIVSLGPTFLTRAACEVGCGVNVRLRPRLGTNDPLIESLVSALRAELESPQGGDCLYAETLATALGAHLARKYSAEEVLQRETRERLTKIHLRKVLEFINDHLEDSLSVSEIASVIGLSSYHFTRLFKASTGMSPHQYVLQRRIERARQLLFDPSISIADIVARLQFCDHSHLATHFKRVYGVTPKMFLKHSSRQQDEE